MSARDSLGEVRTLADGTFDVVYERDLAHPPERVWRALTDADEVAAWFTPATIEPAVGGRARIDFGDDGATDGTVLTWDPPHVLEHEWLWEGQRSVVRWELTSIDTGTRLTLVHSTLRREGAIDFGAGWQYFVDRLPVHLDGGDADTIEDRWEENKARIAERL